MKKLVLQIALLVLSIEVRAQEDWSIHLERAHNQIEYCETFYNLMLEHKDDDSTASGYYALASMMLAKKYKNPFTKLSYFNKGKTLLEDAIENDKGNIELRFLRFAVQNEVPPILLYFNNMEEDKEMLDDFIRKNTSPLANRIITYFNKKNIDYMMASGLAY